MNTLSNFDDTYRVDAIKESRRLKRLAARHRASMTFEQYKAHLRKVREEMYGQKPAPAPRPVRSAHKPALALAHT